MRWGSTRGRRGSRTLTDQSVIDALQLALHRQAVARRAPDALHGKYCQPQLQQQQMLLAGCGRKMTPVLEISLLFTAKQLMTISIA